MKKKIVRNKVKRAKKTKPNYGTRVRNVNGKRVEVNKLPPGPKPRRYEKTCHGEANTDCVRCRVPHFRTGAL